MSMMSELRDNLLRTADEIGETMPDAAALMREAAFVVWELRNVGAENTQMRELVRELWQFVGRADRMQWPELSRQMDELGIEGTD